MIPKLLRGPSTRFPYIVQEQHVPRHQDQPHICSRVSGDQQAPILVHPAPWTALKQTDLWVTDLKKFSMRDPE